MRKRSLVVFGGSKKSLHFIRALNPQSVFLHDDVPSKKKYIDVLNTLDHQAHDIICVNWPFITPESNLMSGNIYTIHESLLPSFSGCAPVNWSIIEGSPLFGITLFRQTKEVDSGQIIFQDGFYMNDANAVSVFKRMKISYEKCANFILANELQDVRSLAGFGNRSYYPKRTPEHNVIEDDFDPDRLVNLFLSTTSDYPLIYKSNGERYKIYAINVFGNIIKYFPLGKPPLNVLKIEFCDSNFILSGVVIND
ncbi:formyltransferase family protein [Alphaproteobacteria bacterium]|nr:formyltransferase family protein [Alphaproteobacteria bacterium]